MKTIFKEAHKMTREIKNKYPSVDYRGQFGLCLKYILNNKKQGEDKMIKLQGSEKQIKWAEDIREKMIKGLEEMLENENFRYHYGEMISVERVKETIKEVKQIKSSKFFIENRYEKRDEVVVIIENMKKAEQKLEEMKNLELAQLEGSKKQVKWAKDIRDEKLKRLAEIENWRWDEYYFEYEKDEIIRVIAEEIKNAKTFIENRDSLDDLIKVAIELIK